MPKETQRPMASHLRTGQVNMSHIVKKPVYGFLTSSDTNRAVQPQKMDGGLKFWIRK